LRVQTASKADPESPDLHTEPEAQRQTDRQAEHPVADQIRDHRRARIAGAAEGPGQHHLGAVEELEDRGHEEQADTGREHARVGREEAQ